ncbi:putative leucine-rich repeat-containing protein DDB_G0290503 [Onthophagus taurus]|uniref:putative leucine-rich repeat-containing protein DDB_G0290503 n=1 Tax=Onthophagus taurus TaxID=166361 RepID=UPI0039BEB39E
MSSRLTNRLDQIENDIRLMMMLQKCGSDSSKSNIDLNSKSVVLQKKLSCDKSYISEKSTKSLPVGRRNVLKFDANRLTCPDIIQPPQNFSNTSSFHDKLSSSGSNVENLKSHSSSPLGLESEYEQTRKRILEEEVMKLKSELSTVLEHNEECTSMINQFKMQNEKMKFQIDEINGKLLDMTKEKDYLCRCLERERGKGTKNNEVTDDTESNSYDENKEEIKSLKESLFMLSKKLEENDQEKQNIIKQKDKLDLKLKKQKEMTKKITEINHKLSNSIKIKHESFIVLRNKNSKCEKELGQCKLKLKKSQEELEKLKRELDDNRENMNKIPKELTEKLNILKEKEQQSQNEIMRWRCEAENLRVKVEESTKRIMKYQENEDSTLAIKKQNQLCVTTSTILRNKTNELQKTVDEQRRKIEELEFIRQHQDVVINSQHEQLLSKDEQIKLQEQENDIVKEKCLQLDKQLEIVRNVLDSRDENQSNNYQKICQLETKIEELKSTLEKERRNSPQDIDKECIKDTEKIKKMSSALEASKQKLEMTIRELDREKENSKVMVNGLEKLTLKKEKLEGMMFNLEGSCNDLLIEKERYAKLCDDLEQELASERKTRVYERAALIDERNRAFDVARMAAVTLIETVEDYELVTKTQMEVKKSICNLVKNKQKRRPGCPPIVSDKMKNTSSESEMINENLDSPQDFRDEMSSSEESDNKQETICNFNPGIIATEGTLRIPIPMTALNPYATVQSTLIPTTPHACWFGNCGYQTNQAMCNAANPYQLASCSNTNQYPNHCQNGVKYSLQKKPSKIRPPIKVVNKKSTNSSLNRNKRSKITDEN